MPRLRPVRPAGWWFDGLLLAALVGLTVALASGHLLGLDRAVADWADSHRPAAAFWVARVLNFLGQGTPLTLLAAGVGVVVGLRLRSVRPILPPVVAFLLTNLTIGPLKLSTDRAAPSASVKPPYLPEADTVRLFHTDGVYGMSYPSGHVANAIVWYGVLALLLPALLRTVGRTVPARLVTVVRVLPPLIVLSTTTYLGWHWLTDSVAGLLLGLLLDRLLHRAPWDDLPLPGPLRHRDRPFTSMP
ncbi:phosphatase PAP2 family protein [Micromonospora sp. A3M-1-15]|uniref:phosphatase PAP2 family protein n=1 Tax=Micromonospora sp. A3M-1-15 TaxID=2962035 RepID=UPI0020B7DCE8|nr:phosphatase PAP2 family protein [Micromonospora sp. A3M-1-15]MCP3783853.1 phosphatase PAP2 family protein [Micromonospora sp. A3M-1-15]